MKVKDKRTGAKPFKETNYGGVIESNGEQFMLCIDTRKNPSEDFLVRISDGTRVNIPPPETVVKVVNATLVIED